jgi:hypothetical protein
MERMGRLAIDDDLSRRETINACDHVDKCGFATPRLSDYGDKFPSLHFHVDAVDSREIASRRLVNLTKVFDLNQWLCIVI